MALINEIFENSAKRMKARYWVISDLQQNNPLKAERYFSVAISDIMQFRQGMTGICYLGDATEGDDGEAIRSMVDMQTELLNSLNLPVYYAMGNHEFENQKDLKLPLFIPMYEKIKSFPNWHTTAKLDDFHFEAEFDDHVMLFFSDHGAPDGSWIAFHQRLRDMENYPYTLEDWQKVIQHYGNCGKTVFTFSHYAFPGGNRPSEYLARLLPLPANFRAHFHGHCHVGDVKYGKEMLYRQIEYINNQAILQFDISSLDHFRGNSIRSAVFDYYGGNEYGVFFRDHINREWQHFYISAADHSKNKSEWIPPRCKL